MRVLVIVLVMILAIVATLLGIWTVITTPAQWFAAILMLMASGGMFTMGAILTKDIR